MMSQHRDSPWKVTRDDIGDGTSKWKTESGNCEIDLCNEGYLLKQRKQKVRSTEAKSEVNANIEVAQAIVGGGGDLLTQPLIVSLKPRGLFVSLCLLTSTCVGALKFPLRRLISGGLCECEFARSCGEVDVDGKSGSFSKSLIDFLSSAS